MKSLALTLIIIAAFVMVPVAAIAQTYQASAATAPISQPLVREGTIAVKMVEVLNLGTTTNEVEAENLLVSVGIAPHNGWIADYPVTPDIATELREAVNDAADSGTLTMKKDEALLAFDGVLKEYNLVVKADTSGQTAESQEGAAYPDNTVINNYYYNEGPPVVTYYAPPPYYAHLYSWVPYPFWWWHFRFSGFFVLVDFHRPFFVHNRVVLLSNHFFDVHRKVFVRVNPVTRFHDRIFVDRGKTVVNVNRRDIRVVGPTEVRGGADKVFIDRSGRSGRSGGGERRLDVDRTRGRSGGDDRRFDVDRSRGRSGGGERRLDVDRTRGRSDSGREIRSGGREGNRMFVPSSGSGGGRSISLPSRRDGAVVSPSGRDGNISRSADRTFRPFSDRSGSSGRGSSFTREMDRAPRVFTPSGGGQSRGGTRLFNAPSGGSDRMFRSSGRGDFSPSSGRGSGGRRGR